MNDRFPDERFSPIGFESETVKDMISRLSTGTRSLLLDRTLLSKSDIDVRDRVPQLSNRTLGDEVFN